MRILVTDDEPRILTFLVRGFEAEGYAVDSAVDGEQALERLRSGSYDVAVLDLLLPKRDGLSVLRELKRDRPELPVVILSARSDLPTKLRGFELGADDYVAKPFSLDELLARVRVQLRRAAVLEVDGVVHAGGLTIDLARREARVNGVAFHLTDLEFRVLHRLASEPGVVVSRERLLSEVWGYHFDPGSNVVDVCIRRLRKKLGAGAPIETVRHAGYRLAA
jgi:two-component system, OmpR family, response regulator